MPVLSKIIQSELQQRPPREAKLPETLTEKGQEESLTMNVAYPEVETDEEDEKREEEDKEKHHCENPRGVAFFQDGGGVV